MYICVYVNVYMYIYIYTYIYVTHIKVYKKYLFPQLQPDSRAFVRTHRDLIRAQKILEYV